MDLSSLFKNVINSSTNSNSEQNNNSAAKQSFMSQGKPMAQQDTTKSSVNTGNALDDYNANLINTVKDFQKSFGIGQPDDSDPSKEAEDYYNWLNADDRTYADWLENTDTASVDGVNYNKGNYSSVDMQNSVQNMDRDQFKDWLLNQKGSERWYGTDDDEYGSISQDVWDAARRGDVDANQVVTDYVNNVFAGQEAKYNDALSQIQLDDNGVITTDSINRLNSALLGSDDVNDSVLEAGAYKQLLDSSPELREALMVNTGLQDSTQIAKALASIDYVNDMTNGKDRKAYSYEDKNLNDVILGGLIDPSKLDMQYGTSEEILNDSRYDVLNGPYQQLFAPIGSETKLGEYNDLVNDQYDSRKINGLWNSYNSYGTGKNGYANDIINVLSDRDLSNNSSENARLKNQSKEAYQKAVYNLINDGKSDNDAQLYWKGKS